MIRVAWLQSRNQTVVAGGLLVAVAIAAVITGIQLSHLYDSLVSPCLGSAFTQNSQCGFAFQHYLSSQDFMDKTLDILARAVPAAVGMFWGAPLLAREFETGTFRLAWTQSVPRTRWLSTRIGLGALATLVLTGLFSLTVTWWYHGRDKIGANLYDVFDRRDIAPVAYALFAFGAGVLFGAVIRRTVPAMAATVGAFVFARIAVSLWIRPHLLAAKHAVVSLARQGSVQLGIGSSNGGGVHIFTQGGGPPNSWTQASHLVSLTGHRLSTAQMTAFLQQHCSGVLNPSSAPAGTGTAPVPAADPGAVCLDQVSKSFKLAISYQPASRYWIFQTLEAGVFVALAAAAIGATFWWVSRKAR